MDVGWSPWVRHHGPVARLVAIDQPGGPQFVDELRRIWDAGDAAFPVDQRLPGTAKRQLCAQMRVGEAVEPGDALVVATSGSSGAPKGVVLTHAAVAASAEATSRRLGVTADTHWLACLPLNHVGGLSVVTRALHSGTRLTVHAGFDATAAMASGATHVSLVATALQRIDPTVFDVIVLGGSRPPADRPPNAVATYGMTETGSGVVYDRRPLDGVEIRNAPSGEIELRCPMLLRCYRDGTDPCTPDGWFPTGDLGEIDADGLLTVHGRADDLIITGGENVWPEPVEAVLRSVPGVADVAVAGTPDDEWGQVVTAHVVGDVTLDVLRAAVKEQLPAFCAPRKLVRHDSLPRTSLGKIRRAQLDAGPASSAHP
jgi:O-succinylbenzoic acid--CoA ligase